MAFVAIIIYAKLEAKQKMGKCGIMHCSYNVHFVIAHTLSQLLCKKDKMVATLIQPQYVCSLLVLLLGPIVVIHEIGRLSRIWIQKNILASIL